MKVVNKILIIEDEEPNADRLKRLLHEIRPAMEVRAVLDSVTNAVAWLANNESPDLIIMDIRLADGLCFEIFHLADVKSPVIFATAYDEYAIKAFKYNSLDYLLKPVEREELETAIEKWEGLTASHSAQQLQIEELLAYVRPKEYRSRFLIPYRDGYQKLNVADIAFLYGQEGVNVAHLFNGERVVIPHTLETLEKELDPAVFFRANRQYIVHIDAIEKVHNYFNGKLKIEVKQGKGADIVISRTKAALIKSWMDY